MCGKSKYFVRKMTDDSGTTSSTASSSQASPTATFVPLLDVASLPPFNPKEDPRLRRKFLEKTNATLKDLQDLARVQEAVNMQVKAMDQSSGQVNAVSGKPHSKGKGKGTAQGRNRGNKTGTPSGGSQETKVRGCFRCNYTDHMARDPNCPARSKKCNACGEIGHFAVCCKTKERKRLTG